MVTNMLTKQQLDLIESIELQIAAIEDGTLDLNGNETLTDRLMDLSCQLLSVFRLIRQSQLHSLTEPSYIDSSFNGSHLSARMTVDKLLQEDNVDFDKRETLQHLRENIDNMWSLFTEIYLMFDKFENHS